MYCIPISYDSCHVVDTWILIFVSKIRDNILIYRYSKSQVMGRLITNDLTNPGAGVLRELMDELRDNIAAVPDPSLDSDLFSLVARCLACDPNLRPRLSQLLDLLEYYTANKTYDGVMEESDFSINRMIQTHIFDVGDQGSADDVIALSPDSLAADVSIMSLGGPDNPIVISPDSSVADFSTMNIESQPAQGSANNPVVIYVSVSNILASAFLLLLQAFQALIGDSFILYFTVSTCSCKTMVRLIS